jgi:hypothetical protein
MKFLSLPAIFRTAKKEIGIVNKDIVSFVGKVSPIVLQDLKPILASADENLWKTAFPLAVQVVEQVFKSGITGFDAHSAAVKQLESAVIATGKITFTAVTRLHLGQIVLAAYANSPAILAALAAIGVAL